MQDNYLLLATCYFRSDQPHRAYHLLKGKGNGPLLHAFHFAERSRVLVQQLLQPC